MRSVLARARARAGVYMQTAEAQIHHSTAARARRRDVRRVCDGGIEAAFALEQPPSSPSGSAQLTTPPSMDNRTPDTPSIDLIRGRRSPSPDSGLSSMYGEGFISHNE
eukprot:scaffold356782_cov31-Prasinocladus_malaysianus.AAC.1